MLSPFISKTVYHLRMVLLDCMIHLLVASGAVGHFLSHSPTWASLHQARMLLYIQRHFCKGPDHKGHLDPACSDRHKK